MALFSVFPFNRYRLLAFVYAFRDFWQLKPNQGLCLCSAVAGSEDWGLIVSKDISADSSNNWLNLLVISFMLSYFSIYCI